MNFLIINGPNLNLLGQREPALYGHETLEQLERLWKRVGARLGVDIETLQSNHEGMIIDAIQQARGSADALILNAGAYSHTSRAIQDAISATSIRTVEIHISNIHEREEWRRHSVISDVADLVIVGRGSPGYVDAIKYLHAQLTVPPSQFRYAVHGDGFLDLRVPDGDGPHPVVIAIHGGFWRDIWLRDTIDPIAAALVQHGYATVNPEYHRGPGSYHASNEDIDAVIDWIHAHGDEHGLDTDNIVLIGHSAGGYHALNAAHRRNDFAGAVGMAAVTDLEDIVTRYSDLPGVEPATSFVGVPLADDPDTWNAASLSGSPQVPVHLIHGTDDADVDISQARSYASRAGDLCELSELEAVDHFKVIDPRHASFDTLLEAIKGLRRAPGSG